jgi:hypothetical protein
VVVVGPAVLLVVVKHCSWQGVNVGGAAVVVVGGGATHGTDSASPHVHERVGPWQEQLIKPVLKHETSTSTQPVFVFATSR